MIEIRNTAGHLLEIIENDFVLTKKVNDFENPHNIGASYTSSMQAYATDANKQFFGLSNSLSIDTPLTNQKIFVIVKWNGNEIDANAYILLQSFDDDKFIFNIFFSESSFAQILGDKTLNDLALGSVNYQVPNMNFTNTSLDYINALFFIGGKSKKAWYECVYSWKLKALFLKIIQEAGYTTTTLPAELDWLSSTYVVPSREKFDFEEQFENRKRELEGVQRLSSNINIVNTTPFTQFINFDVIEGDPTYFKNTYYQLLTGYVYHVKFYIKIRRNNTTFPQSLIAHFSLGYITNLSDPAGSFVSFHQPTFVVMQDVEQEYELEYTITIAGAEFPPILRVYLQVWQPSSIANNTNWTILAGSYMQVTVAEYIPETLFTYDHAKNLPAVSQREFLKNILYLSGCTLSVNNYTKVVKIKSVQDIIEDTNNIIDLSDKIDFENKSISYRISSFARKTLVKFKNSEEGAVSYEVSDTNLPDKRDISLAFQRATNLNTAPPVMLVDIRNFKEARIIAPSDAKEDAPTENVNCPNLFCETEKKGLDFVCGRLLGIGNLVEFLTRTPRNNTQNTVVSSGGNVENLTFVRADIWRVPAGSFYLQAFQDLGEFSDNFAYVQNLYENFREVVVRAYLPATLVFSDLTDKKVLIRGEVNRLFLIKAINNYRSQDEPCDLVLLRINHK